MQNMVSVAWTGRERKRGMPCNAATPPLPWRIATRMPLHRHLTSFGPFNDETLLFLSAPVSALPQRAWFHDLVRLRLEQKCCQTDGLDTKHIHFCDNRAPCLLAKVYASAYSARCGMDLELDRSVDAMRASKFCESELLYQSPSHRLCHALPLPPCRLLPPCRKCTGGRLMRGRLFPATCSARTLSMGCKNASAIHPWLGKSTFLVD